MIRRIIMIVVVLIASMIASYGCYTIIKHPSLQKAEHGGEGETWSHDDLGRDCVSCHQDYHQYPYGYYYGYYPDYYWTYPRWGDYYNYPWWWDYYWYDGGSERGQAAEPDVERKPSERRGLEPPYVTGSRSADSLAPPPTFDAGTTQPPVIGTPGGTTTGGTVTNPPVEQPKETPKKESKKPPRRRGLD